MAVELDDQARCPNCGTRHEDWFDGDRELRPLEQPLVVDVAKCEGCARQAAKRRELDAHTRDDPGAADGRFVTWVRRLHPSRRRQTPAP